MAVGNVISREVARGTGGGRRVALESTKESKEKLGGGNGAGMPNQPGGVSLSSHAHLARALWHCRCTTEACAEPVVGAFYRDQQVKYQHGGDGGNESDFAHIPFGLFRYFVIIDSIIQSLSKQCTSISSVLAAFSRSPDDARVHTQLFLTLNSICRRVTLGWVKQSRLNTANEHHAIRSSHTNETVLVNHHARIKTRRCNFGHFGTASTWPRR